MYLPTIDHQPPTARLRRIGLLGGSFNPAHGGHVQVSEEALKRLRLDEIWWLVSPQNPLKPTQGMADYDTRLAEASALTAQHPRIVISDIERGLHTRYTVDTVKKLQHRFPRIQFVWLMGSDNLAQFHRWREWDSLAASIPIAVFDRAPFSHYALRSKAALRLAGRRFLAQRPHGALNTQPPTFTYVFMRRHPASGTEIRNSLGKSVKQAHNEDDDT